MTENKILNCRVLFNFTFQFRLFGVPIFVTVEILSKLGGRTFPDDNRNIVLYVKVFNIKAKV